MRDEKPFVMLGNHSSKRKRWYPHEALARIIGSMYSGESDSLNLPWELLDPKDAAEWLPELRDRQRSLKAFAAMVEAIAAGQQPAACPVCQSRFYPSRSDARYCSGRCRMRAHRGKAD